MNATIIKQTQTKQFLKVRGVKTMAKSSNKSVVPEAREALDRFKMEAASEVGVQSPLEENIHIL